MPEPLLTYECYDDFIRAASLTEDRVSTLFTILKKLPKPNYDLMERLIFHLARFVSDFMISVSSFNVKGLTDFEFIF